jgi:2-keto-3-deoxy-L-rhamnonate aldolase RhmA
MLAFGANDFTAELGVPGQVTDPRVTQAISALSAAAKQHLPDGQRDTGEILNLLADWAPAAEARQAILVDGPHRLFFSG